MTGPALVRRWLGPALALVLTAGAFIALRRELREYSYRDITNAMDALPLARVGLALAVTALAWVVLAGYDALALRYVGHRLTSRRTALASLTAYAVAMNVGFSALAGASVRWRFWSAWGLGAAEIARGVAFITLTFWLGVLVLGGAGLALDPMPASLLSGMPVGALRLAGVPLIGVVAGYVAWSATARRPIAIRRFSFGAPGLRTAGAQVVVSALDWALAAAALYVLLPPAPGLGFGGFVVIYVVAQIAGLVSHVPGGLGVFETLMIVLLGPYVEVTDLLPALIAYRIVYYLLPLAVAAAAMGAYEVSRRAPAVPRALRALGAWGRAATPRLLSVATFAAGTVLLVSGATPAVHSRLARIDALLPLGVVEISHFLGSVAGMGLVLLAFGIARRLDAAYGLAVAALVVGIVASILKGLDYEEALVLGAVLAAIAPARRHFNRRAALTSEAFTPGWLVAVLLALGGTIWLGLFSYQHVGYTADLWWRFALSADAPRFLRATVGAAGVLVAFGLARLLRPGAAAAERPDAAALERARAIIERDPHSSSSVALLGDKALLFSEDGDGFLMYGARGRSLIALGDPVGPAGAQRELVWRFRELADAHGAWPIFYEVSTACLPLYLDLGLAFAKIGEEATVALGGFSLEGPARRGLRRTLREVERSGCTFEIAAPESVPALLGDLRRISDEWLAMKHTREKGFSVGCFDEAYLSRFPIALVRRGGEPVAFANLWATAVKDEISVDLMRYTPGAPRSVMEYLFARLMLWGRDAGYATFNLGMAPLSGLPAHALATPWHRAGSLLYRYGEHVYGFRGLRQYKEKFDPVWTPRYLAFRGGLSLPRALANVAALVSGGLLGVVTK